MEGAVPQGIAPFLLLATQRLTRRPSSTNASVNRFPVSASIPMVTSVTMGGSEGASCAKGTPFPWAQPLPPRKVKVRTRGINSVNEPHHRHAQFHRAIAELHTESPAMHEEELIFVRLLMPVEGALELHRLHPLPGEPGVRPYASGAGADADSVAAGGRRRLPQCPPRSRGCASWNRRFV